MTLGAFVRKNRPQWQRLEEMLGFIETRGPRRTDRPFLRELTSLYRATTGDLAFAQTHYRGTTILLFLHQLVARAHNQIYRAPRFTFVDVGRFRLPGGACVDGTGVTPDVAAAVWIGHDDGVPMSPGKAGGAISAPVWIKFMKTIYLSRPTRQFPD